MIARALETGAFEGTGIHSPEQWVAWKCGASGGRAPDPDEKEKEKDKPEEPEEARRVDFGTTEEGAWRLSALLPPDEGAVVERALDAARRALADEAQVQRPTWADALLAMADRSLGATARRPAPSGPSPGGGARARRRARPQCPRS